MLVEEPVHSRDTRRTVIINQGVLIKVPQLVEAQVSPGTSPVAAMCMVSAVDSEWAVSAAVYAGGFSLECGSAYELPCGVTAGVTTSCSLIDSMLPTGCVLGWAAVSTDSEGDPVDATGCDSGSECKTGCGGAVLKRKRRRKPHFKGQ